MKETDGTCIGIVCARYDGVISDRSTCKISVLTIAVRYDVTSDIFTLPSKTCLLLFSLQQSSFNPNVVSFTVRGRVF